MKILTFVYLLIALTISSVSQDVVLQTDNNVPRTSGYSNVWMMEETKLIMPAGPCTVKELQIYFTGNKPNKDTIYVVGDPAAGSISPTFWCLSYNMKLPPIYFDYPGTPGWYKFPLSGLRLDGLDRLVVQHRVQPDGPWFAVDSDGLQGPSTTSFLMNPFQNNSLGGPGQFYLAGGDFMVRALVEFDMPDGNGSLPPPPPALFDVTVTAGLVDANGNPMKHTDVTVQDVNGDGWDDIIIKNYLFINQKDGTFKRSNALNSITASFTLWADYDNDGDLDFYALANGSYDQALNMVMSRDRIVRNDGNLSFTAMPVKSTFNLPYPSPGKDFSLPNQYEQDSIFNPYSCITPLWIDYNSDGKLDLFLANNRVGFNVNNQYNERYFPDQLWKQQQNGTFTNTTTASGIAAAEPFSKPNNNWFGYYDCYGANAADYNNDGKSDIFVANYRLVKDNLYKNNGNETFADVAAQTGVQGVPTAQSGYYGHGMGSEWADFNNDGFLDICIGNLGHPDWRGAVSNPSLIYKNSGPPNYIFSEVHSQMGLKFFEMNAGVLWADFNNDGFQDLWHGQISYEDVSATAPQRPGLLYMNQGPPDYKLRDMTWYYGCALHGPWSAARIDYDNDGDMDIIICSQWNGVRLFRNDIKKSGDWISFRISGYPNEQVNNDAFGTKLYVYNDGKMFMRELNSISGTRGTQNTNELHFGIGNTQNASVDSVVLVYPNLKRHKLTNIAKNNKYHIPYMGQALDLVLATPQLILPENNSFKNKQNDLLLQWSLISSAKSYDIEIYSDPQLLDVFLEDNISANQTSINGFENNHTYYWRVRAVDGTSAGSWSSVWNFTVGNLLPNPPNLIYPENNAVDIALNPNFKWKESAYPGFFAPKTTYNLIIADDAQMNNILFNFTLIDSVNYYLSDTLLPNKEYYWRVRGSNEDAFSEWSELRKFKTMNIAPAPILISPPNEATNVPNKPNFTWEAVPGAQNYLLLIAEDEEFSNLFFESSSLVLNSTKVFKNFTPGNKYWWKVRANRSGYLGEWSDAWWFTIVNETSFQDAEDSFMKISPVPATDYIDIDITEDKNDEIQIVIFNVLSLNVLSQKIEKSTSDTSIRIDLSGLNPGLYFVKAGNKIKRFVKI